MIPADADFDHMHHALGRPVTPNADTYRNHFCCEAGGLDALRFEALGWWDFVRHINVGRDAIYSVNGSGKAALATWLAEKQRKAGVRPYAVSGRDLTTRIIVAKSRSAAKYDAYLQISDVREYRGGFGGFLKVHGVTARAA